MTNSNPSFAELAKGKKWPWFIGGILLLIPFAGQCSPDMQASSDRSLASSSTSKTTITTTTAATITSTTSSLPPSSTVPAPKTSSGPIAAKPDGATFTDWQAEKGQIVQAEVPVDGLTTGSIRRHAQEATIQILQYVKAAYPNFAGVVVQGNYAQSDKYGNPGNVIVMNVRYERSSVDRINFSGIQKETIWDIRDGGTINDSIGG